MKKMNLHKMKIKNKSNKKERKPGMLKDKIVIKKDFEQISEEFMEYFEQDGKDIFAVSYSSNNFTK
ncbi:hypothetical protein BH09DEP1_BH09DEP1_0030 [soil metagenome]